MIILVAKDFLWRIMLKVDGNVGLKITNNIYNNPLKLENKHDWSAGWDIQTLTILTNKVCLENNLQLIKSLSFQEILVYLKFEQQIYL